MKRLLLMIGLVMMTAGLSAFGEPLDKAVTSLGKSVAQEMANKSQYKLVLFEFQQKDGSTSEFSAKLMEKLQKELGSMRSFTAVTPVALKDRVYMESLTAKQRKAIARTGFDAACIGTVTLKKDTAEVKVSFFNLAGKNGVIRWSFDKTMVIDRTADVNALIVKPEPVATVSSAAASSAAASAAPVEAVSSASANHKPAPDTQPAKPVVAPVKPIKDKDLEFILPEPADED